MVGNKTLKAMIKVYNNIIPFKGYKAMAVWPFLFIRKGAVVSEKLINHESIHGAQQRELLFVGAVLTCILGMIGCSWWSLFALPLFYYWYGVEWLVKWAIYRDTDKAYKNIGFENEAYGHEGDMDYLRERRLFDFVYYI